MRSRAAPVLAVAGAGVLIVACGAPTTSPSVAATSVPTHSPAPSITALPVPSSGGAIEIDAALLAHLPAEVDGLPLAGSPAYDAEAAADPAVAAYGAAVATAIVADPGTGEFATVALVRLRASFDDAAFRQWRDSFDAGVCERAGGVVRNAEAEIAGRHAWIGTCAEGVRTYHLLLGNREVLVSVSALGERRLGERLVEGLRD